LREVGPGNTALVGYVTSDNGAEPDVPQLRAALAKSLPEYMVPQHWVVLAELPLSPSGKVDRNALPAPMLEGQAEAEFVPPTTETQQRLGAIWAEVLGVPRVGLQDDFFDLGGHSILATRVASRVRRDFAVEVPLRMMFVKRTLEQLAEEVDGRLTAVSVAAAGDGDGVYEEEIVI